MKDEDATPNEGVSEAVAEDIANSEISKATPEEKVLPVNPREAAMAAVVSSRKELLASEGVGLDEESEDDDEQDEDDIKDVVETKEVDKKESTPKTQGRTISVTLQDGTKVEVPESSIGVPVKVDGQEFVESLDKVSKSYQKDSAVSKRMEEASKRARELDQREQELLSREQNMQLSQDAASKAPPSQDAQEEARKVIAAMTDGTEEEAIEALASIMGRKATPETPQISTAEIAQEVARSIEGKDAGKWFKDEYKDIIADDYLFRMTDESATRLLENNPGMTHREAFEQAGNTTREWVSKFAPAKPVDDLENRRSKKRSAAQSIPKSSAKASIGKDAPPPPTNSDIIAEMKRLRGQPI